MQSGNSQQVQKDHEGLIRKIYRDDKAETEIPFEEPITEHTAEVLQITPAETSSIKEEDKYHFAEEIEEEETLSLHDKELELIKKSLERHRGKRKAAAEELGISERTLYRKIKQYDL